LTENSENKKFLLRYSGLAAQFIAGIALTIFIGLKADKWMNISIPLLVWFLPLLIIVGMIIKIYNETSKKK